MPSFLYIAMHSRVMLDSGSTGKKATFNLEDHHIHMVHRPAKSWLKITVDAPARFAEVIAAFISTLTGSGTEQTSGGNDTAPAGREKIIGYLIDNQQWPVLERQLHDFLNTLHRQLFPDTAPATLRTELIEEIDWNETWKQHFKPFMITPGLVIKPTWEPYKPIQDEAIIEIDPGMAFGTGHHASTRLALELIEVLFFSKKSVPQRVLDVGTGTGILGMACARFGAEKIIAVDNDPDAVAIAKENVALNTLATKMAVSNQNLANLNDSFNLIVANITHNILTELAPDLIRLLAPSGHLVLAGILKGDQQECIKIRYADLGLVFCDEKTHDEWAGLCFTKEKF